jgi:hypothetical protein
MSIEKSGAAKKGAAYKARKNHSGKEMQTRINFEVHSIQPKRKEP